MFTNFLTLFFIVLSIILFINAHVPMRLNKYVPILFGLGFVASFVSTQITNAIYTPTLLHYAQSLNSDNLIVWLLFIFLLFSIVEHGIKYAILAIASLKISFSNIFESIVYSLSLALGFFAYEVMMFIINMQVYHINTSILTSSMRGNIMMVFSAVFMGTFFGAAKRTKNTQLYILGVAVPILTQILYDLTFEYGPLVSILFIAYALLMFWVCIELIRKDKEA